jgi:hypothetical protein
MANTVISPDMRQPVPVVSVDPGPDWANNINACLSIIDGHNHTPGSGVPITPAAININSDLPFNNNNLITARSVRFQPQGSPLNLPADLGALFEQGVDLYYIDGSGNVIRLTQSGAPAGATGTITGLPSGTASASFAGTTFTFQSATNTPASLAVGPVTIAQAVPSGFGVTLSANGAESTNYNLTLPVALPAVTGSFLSSDLSGNLSFVNYSDPWTPYTPTYSTGVTVTGGSLVQWRKVGQNMEIYADLEFSTLSSPSGNFSVSLPTGFTIATADYPNGTANPFGNCYFLRIPSSNQYAGLVQWDGNSVTSNLIFSTSYGASGSGGAGVTILPANQVDTNDLFSFSCSFKCAQF